MRILHDGINRVCYDIKRPKDEVAFSFINAVAASSPITLPHVMIMNEDTSIISAMIKVAYVFILTCRHSFKMSPTT